MQSFPPTIILRHKRENLKKCSLRGLEGRNDMRFFSYPKDFLPDLSSTILLTLDAPPLSESDKNRGLFIIDGTWRYAEKMLEFVEKGHQLEKRSLPSYFRTAYPRRQEDCPDPERGLSSLEALFAAYHILGRDTSGLIENYYWKELFLKKNGLDFLISKV